MSTNQRILQLMLEKHPRQSVIHIERLDVQSIKEIVANLPISQSKLILEKMNVGKISSLIGILEMEMAVSLIEQLTPTLALSVLRMTDISIREQVLSKMSIDHSGKLEKMLAYPENTIGAMVDPFVVTLTDDLSVQQALDTIAASKLKLYPNTLVLDRNRTIKGHIDIRQLLAADHEASISPFVIESTDHILADMDRETQLKNWNFQMSSVAVVDLDGLFLGVISKDDLSHKKTTGKTNVAGKTASMALGDLYRVGLSGLFYGSEEPNEKEN